MQLVGCWNLLLRWVGNIRWNGISNKFQRLSVQVLKAEALVVEGYSVTIAGYCIEGLQ